MKKNLNGFISIFFIVLCIILAGCSSIGLAEDAAFDSNYEIGNEEVEDIYVSAQDVMFKSCDPSSFLIDFYVLGSSDIMTLSFDGATSILDKFGTSMSIVQLQPGDIAHIDYNSTISKVGRINLLSDAFSLTDISKYSFNEALSEVTIGDTVYSINNNIHVFSDGGEIALNQIINNDGLTFQGRGHEILSIRVDDGHGYLDLDNEEALIGGWIEIGQTVISQVAENMLFTVPEGEYTVRLTNDGIEEYRSILITRNQVTTLDLADIVSPLPEKGIVKFNITPEKSETYVDGSYVDTHYAIKLALGMHEITVSASGYATVTEFFDVSGEDQTITIDLEKANSENTVSGNNINKNLYANIIINTPYGVEVYEDNIYKGITPVSYQKTPGTHTITLRKPGYATVSYTIVVSDDGKDETYAFPEMTYDSTVSGNNLYPTPTPKTVSGNDLGPQTVSGNNMTPTPSASPYATPTATPTPSQPPYVTPVPNP